MRSVLWIGILYESAALVSYRKYANVLRPISFRQYKFSVRIDSALNLVDYKAARDNVLAR